MKKLHLSLLGLCALLVLGAGCTQAELPDDDDALLQKKSANTTMDKSENTTKEDGAMMEDEKMIKEDDSMMKEDDEKMMKEVTVDENLELFVKALGDRKVELKWNAPSGLDESNRFIIVYGKTKDVAHDGKNFWFRKYYSNKDMIWDNLPLGERYFRLCLTENNKEDTCTRYSKAVKVTIE